MRLTTLFATHIHSAGLSFQWTTDQWVVPPSTRSASADRKSSGPLLLQQFMVPSIVQESGGTGLLTSALALGTQVFAVFGMLRWAFLPRNLCIHVIWGFQE